MQILRVILLAALAMVPCAVRAQMPTDVQRIILEEAANGRVPPALALAVARVESNFAARALSPAGARGVMQLMPKTARDVFGVREDELWNARLNIQLGLDYLEQLYDQYGGRWDLALSHYNGGTLTGGAGARAIPHTYTRKYVADVLHWQRVYSAAVFEQPSIRWRRAPARPARDDKPWRKPGSIDPLEFNDWAEVEQRRLMMRRNMDDFSRTQ